VLRAEWEGDSLENAKTLVQDFESYLEENRDQIEALTIFYNQPRRRSALTYAMIKALLDKLNKDRPRLGLLGYGRLTPTSTITRATIRQPH